MRYSVTRRFARPAARDASRRTVSATIAALLAAVLVVLPVTAAGAQPGGPTRVERVDWLTDRRVALWIHSAAMNTAVQIQLLLARDWNTKPDSKFPVLFMLDGLRAQDNESGWTLDAKAEPFYADKNVNIVLPVGGQSSFYADWVRPDKGRNSQWETFLIKELPPILENQWRSTNVRGFAGVSMGGTSAMFLAARNPGYAKYVASYSGVLSTTSVGMPQAIQYAMNDAGGYDALAMWGPPSSPKWAEHDPYLLADKLRGTSLYISSGSGMTGPYDQPSPVPGISTNLAGTGLEILSRLTSQSFATKLNKLGIPAQVNYRPSGTHSWAYWDFEMRQSWPQAATALGTQVDKPACNSVGEIGGVAKVANWLGDCLTGEYAVPGGLAQDYRTGRVFYSQKTGAHPVAGRIGGAYQAAGGPAGPLGLPSGPERGLPDNRGRMQPFQNGIVYWTPQTGAHAVRGAILAEWGKQGYEKGPLGYPVAAEVKTPKKDGAVQGFEIGAMYYSPATGTNRVQGLIMAKYAALGYENSWLGFPKSSERPLKDFGKFNEFENGSVYWSPLSGAWAVENGLVMDAYKAAGYENGKLGFPISDRFDVPGGWQQNFQFGNITVKNGKAEVH